LNERRIKIVENAVEIKPQRYKNLKKNALARVVLAKAAYDLLTIATVRKKSHTGAL
jgi:hypothetical protein